MVGPEQSREELHNVLGSGLFVRSARQAKLLSYICEKTLAGEAATIKEYSIAIEALGRGADFDKSTDSTVRFEAHRLRKKLRQHYENGSHEVCILLEPGTYVPRFLAPEEYRQSIRGAPPEDSEPPLPRWWRRWWWGPVAAGIGLLVLLAYSTLGRPGAPAAAERSTSAPPAASTPDAGSIRILAGMSSSGYIDRSGRFWSGDSDYDGGVAERLGPEHITRTGDPGLFQSCRVGPEFGYSIPAAPGNYQMRLYFEDPDIGLAAASHTGQARTFTVSVNGQPVLRDVNVESAAGGRNAALIRAFRDVRPGRDGKIHLRFGALPGAAFVNAIEFLPMAGDRIQPIRFTTQSQPVIDRAGNFWAADDFYAGGRQVVHSKAVQDTPDAALYKGERVGDFSYYIPVPPGEYGVTLFLTESRSDPPGNRLFDVHGKEARGAYRVLTRKFHGLKPDSEGQLVLTFSRNTDPAIVSAIEVQDETP
jgi:hypothetical protein